MSANPAGSGNKATWKWPVISIAVIGIVIFLSGVTSPKGPNNAPVITNNDQYEATLQKANAIFAEETVKSDAGQTLTEEDTKKMKDAVQMYEELNTFNPVRMGPFFASGRLYLILGDSQTAALRFKQVIDDAFQATPDPPPAVKQIKADAEYYLSICLENQNNFADVLPEMDDAIKAFPNRPDYRYVRARALIQAKQVDKAKADLEVAVKYKPDDPKISSLLKFVSASH